MSNHFHLSLEVVRFATARILQSLHTGYVRRFKKMHHRRGHFFEGRYKAVVCDQDGYLWNRFVTHILIRECLGKEKRGLIDSGTSDRAVEHGCSL